MSLLQPTSTAEVFTALWPSPPTVLDAPLPRGSPRLVCFEARVCLFCRRAQRDARAAAAAITASAAADASPSGSASPSAAPPPSAVPPPPSRWTPGDYDSADDSDDALGDLTDTFSASIDF